MVYIQPRFNYLPAKSATPRIDRHIIPWLPMVRLPTASVGTDAVLVRDLAAAREEYVAEVLAASSPEERKKRREKLFKVSRLASFGRGGSESSTKKYAVRCHWSRALYMVRRQLKY